MTQEKRRAAIYAKAASTQELTSNFEMAEQIRQCSEFALSAGFEVVPDQIYEETISENSENRPILEALLEAAKEEGFDVLLVSSYSRLAGKPSVLIGFTRLLAEMGIEVISITEMENDADNTADEIIEQFHRKLILSRTKTNKQAPN